MMKAILIVGIVFAGCFSMTVYAEQGSGGNTPGPISSVWDTCQAQTEMINVAVLTEAAEILKSSRPDLAKELSSLATRAVGRPA